MKKLIKKLIEILESTCVMWLPVLALYIASKITITGEAIINGCMILGIISVITVILIDRR